MKRLLLAAVLLLAACGSKETRQAPDFSLKALDGSVMTLAQHRGGVVLVNFWATWCESCKDELPALEFLHRRRSGEKIAILAVSMDEDASQVPPFVKTHRLTFPVLYADQATIENYAVRALPTSFLVAPDGTISRRYVGPLDVRAVENDILALQKRRPS